MRAWSILFVFQVCGTWHDEQLAANRSRCGSVWQLAQLANATFLYVLVLWHEAHVTDRWAPLSGNAVRLWSNFARVSAKRTDVVWHVPQSDPSVPLCASVWHDAHDGLAVKNDRILWQAVQSSARGA